MNRIYLDWNATAPVLPEAREAMVEALSGVPGNASSVHHEGQIARTVVERARRAVAKAVNAPAQAVVLTGGATESNNQVLRHHVRVTDEPFVICTAVEHPSVIEVVRDLEQEGVRCAIWPVDAKGRLDLGWLEAKLDEGATLVSVMWANNEIGNVYPIAEIAELVHDKGATLHVDGTQALGRIPVDFNGADIDYMTLSFHKMGGPKGIGAIVLREGIKIEAILAGGHQERGRRPGTENVPAAAGLVGAMAALGEQGDAWREALQRKRALFLEALTEQAPGLELRGDLEHTLPNTLNVAFEGIDGEDFLLAADLEGVSASSGSACTAGSLEPSHVVLAMGFEHDDARRSVRFSFGPATPDEDLMEAARRVGAIVERLSALMV
ncbi:cysteine desulfurase [Persicimonas caeni]|uniref:Cysteine desulfurase n=1 Tax=Persicimonas caeni TaxID=2292766 RepID=A0A4Y6Q2D3_PERCE|nr:cysteine desulfurase family protein [Persicimonas caeni]QDG54155.1 cysteine desulfurase [Persicimonas caeni]QED35376.1 cysteine desulfurase [Persicimonas caeni]